MPRRLVSGKRCIQILCRDFGFRIVRRRASHVVLRKETPGGAIGTVVPLHKELRRGTRGVLDLARVDLEEFYELA